MIRIDGLIGKTTFVTGSCKNAGKTTLLVYLLRLLRERTTVCYTSAGLDGESGCAVTGGEKPAVLCRPGDMVVTSGPALAGSTAGFEILEVFPWRSALGRTVLARVASAGSVELVGPETNSRLTTVLCAAREACGDLTVLVDGAADRQTQISSVPEAGYVHTVLLHPLNFDKTVKKIELLGKLDGLPLWTGEDGKTCMLDGALTTRTVFPGDTENLVVRDHGKIFLAGRELEKLRSRIRVFVLHRFPMRFCMVRCRDLDGLKTLEILRERVPSVHFEENPYSDRATA